MDVVKARISPVVTGINPHVRSTALFSAFAHYSDKIKILSLDCFDTLLWRYVATPNDLFYDMQNRQPFKALGITALHRTDAELSARRLAYVTKATYEVNLEEIYRIGFPTLAPHQIKSLVDEEINAEIENCFAYLPVVDLIRLAHKRGIKIIITSNTYLNKLQLAYLLSHALPPDVMSAIDMIFCSSDFGISKSDGLFQQVLNRYRLPSESLLHIGDTWTADYIPAVAIGMNAIHLVQFDAHLATLFRLQAIAATIADASIRSTRALQSPFRALLASVDYAADLPATTLGYVGMGQIMYAFARFIVAEVEERQRVGQQPKLLFLMRDAYLPALACDVLFEDMAHKPSVSQIAISRFSATAASFRTKADIDDYLSHHIHQLPSAMICNQLFIPKDIAAQFTARADATPARERELIRLIQQEKIIDYILQASAKYRKRLMRYLEREANIKPGDALIFVDIGYKGTIQNLLTPILQQDMGISDISGLYLIALNRHDWLATRRGLIDPSWCDDRMMDMLLDDITLIEEFCCSDDNSVYDYAENGTEIGLKSAISDQQREKIHAIQNECVRFVRDARHFFKSSNLQVPLQLLRDAALFELTRLLYLPFEVDIQYVQSFEHDVNEGATALQALYGTLPQELANVKRQGLLFKHQHPYGLRAANLELVITLLSQRRFGFNVYLEDLSLRRENITVIKIVNGQAQQRVIGATPTHDGYFSLLIPVDKNVNQLGMMFGAKYKMLQIEYIELLKEHELLRKHNDKHVANIANKVAINQMANKGGNLFECFSTASALLLTPCISDNENYVIRVVFRPILRLE